MTDARSSTLETDAAKIRHVLMRELETISEYEALARAAASPEVRAFFEHLALEEKEHVAEATYLLRRLDADQNANFEKSFSDAHFAGAVPSSVPANTDLAAPAADRNQPLPASNVVTAPVHKTVLELPERIPHDPGRTVYALPAPPNAFGGEFTVGPLKRRR